MSDLVRFVFSGGGAAVVLGLGAIYMAARPASRRARSLLLTLAVFYILASIYAVPEAVSRPLLIGRHPFVAADIPPGRTAIVVLGSGSITVHDWDGRRFSLTDPYASARVLEAVRIFRLMPSATVIGSGGNVDPDDPGTPTGESIAAALVALGIPADQVLVETEARTTHEEALVMRRTMQARQLDRAILVTSEVHMLRSLGAFKAVGIVAVPAIARSPLADLPAVVRWRPDERGLWHSSLVAHEYLGIAYYAVRGWFVR